MSIVGQLPSEKNISTLTNTAVEARSSPIFVLSCERSGSTMLRYIIDTHSEVACPAHLYLGRLCADLNITLSGTLAQLEHKTQEYEQCRRWAVNKTRNVIQEIMDNYVRGKGKKIWCEKTPMNLEFLEQLEEHFPNARYICLYRQCMDVVISCVNLSRYKFLPEHVPYVNRNPGNILAAMVENWIDKTEMMLRFEAKNSTRCYRVKYESIVSNPEDALPPMFHFIGVNWEDDLIERVFSSEHDGGEGDGKAALSSKIRQNTVGRGVDIPRKEVPAHLLEHADELLSKLGYASFDEYYIRNSNYVYDEDRSKTKINEDLAGLFENHLVEAVKNKAQYPTLSGTWKIIVNDEINQSWVINLSGTEADIRRGDFSSDSTIKLSSYVLQEVLAGRIEPVLAFSQGDINLEGDEASVLNFGRLLFSGNG